MEKSLLAIDGFMPLLAGVAIFVLLFVTILNTLKEVSFFKGATVWVIASCVSLLSVVALCRFFLPEGQGSELTEKSGRFRVGLDFILLPYAALAIAILMCLLLVGISKIFPGRKQTEYPARKKSPVIMSEQHQSTNEEKRIRK